MVRRVSIEAQSSDQLKPAAAMTETGDLRDILNLQWRNDISDNGPLIQKVLDSMACNHYRSKISLGDRLPYIQNNGDTFGPCRHNLRS